MRAAIFIFVVIMLGAIAVGQHFGFWIDLLPYLKNPKGPGGLNSDFAVGMAVEGLSAVIQIAIAFLIFDRIANRHRRREKEKKRSRIGDNIVDIYTEFLTEPRGHQWPLRENSVFRTRLREEWADLLIENSEGLTPSIVKNSQEAHKNFEKLFFVPDQQNVVKIELGDANLVIKHLKALLISLGYKNKTPFLTNKDRVQKLNELRNAMKSRLRDSYNVGTNAFEDKVNPRLQPDLV